MNPLVLLFPTFLKLMHFPLEHRKRILKRRFLTDGYDYDRSVKEAVHDFAMGHVSSHECKTRFSMLANDDEAKHNQYCFEVFHRWFVEHSPSVSAPPQATYVSETGYLRVKIQPEVCVNLGDYNVALHLWNALEPKLEIQPAANAILLMRQTFQKLGIENIRSGLFDGRTAKIILDEIISEGTVALLPRELRATESIWIELNQENTERQKPSGRPKRRDAPSDKKPKGPAGPPK